jgi:hypothetical protein
MDRAFAPTDLALSHRLVTLLYLLLKTCLTCATGRDADVLQTLPCVAFTIFRTLPPNPLKISRLSIYLSKSLVSHCSVLVSYIYPCEPPMPIS